jgi:hypothetical protein
MKAQKLFIYKVSIDTRRNVTDLGYSNKETNKEN